MKKILLTLLPAALVTCMLPRPAAADTEGAEMLPLRIQSYVDLGQVVKGSSEELAHDRNDLPGAGNFSNYFLSNIGVALVQEAKVRDRLDVKIGVGGLFWYPFPNLSATSRIIKFGPGISEASFDYAFSPASHFKFGYFPYKYNPEAVDLGEYLFRSECYPTFVKTGGWSWLSSASSQTLGAQWHWEALGGAWRNDLLLFSEFEESPIWDFSPAYVTSLKVGKALEIGGGVSLHRYLPIQPSAERPDIDASTYLEIDNFPALPARWRYDLINENGDAVPGNIRDSVLIQEPFAGGTMKEMESHIEQFQAVAGDPNSSPQIGKDSLGRVYVRVNTGNGPVTYYPRVVERLNFQGIKLMGRASLDFKALLGVGGGLGPEDLKLYGELAVLGIKDQPYYYENIRDRMPMMAGFNLPTFGLADLLSVEVEYFKNPWPDSKAQSFGHTWPIFELSQDDNPAIYHENALTGIYNEDDWKWSVNLMKTLTRGLQLQVQAANDHFRLRDDFGRPSVMPATNRKSHWYYLTRLQWGI